jgi:hypothetical protein
VDLVLLEHLAPLGLLWTLEVLGFPVDPEVLGNLGSPERLSILGDLVGLLLAGLEVLADLEHQIQILQLSVATKFHQKRIAGEFHR